LLALVLDVAVRLIREEVALLVSTIALSVRSDTHFRNCFNRILAIEDLWLLPSYFED